ncbi:hypothetical protein P280DRAFT_534209 [Massarina eburnea CBS 473.64]|uniref:AAA+ ATPase domain-containing protein n=1 Tax=Massarina eburnea CBS 473.64 TaxID=1395130 RepID=A0A6A6RN01_9PLEO|nr:hypothetical protein P280DRAFT_534209 [Massarina eburnea CBS 473.64]
MPPNGSNLTITNPLVLYRSFLATNRIQPDPAQHRLALHLQKLYERLIDYEPSIEYSERLKQLSRTIATNNNDHPNAEKSSAIGTKGIWTSLLARKEKRDSLALTRVLTSHEAALNLQSPKGLMLHGEVGTGKSMLIDLFADCLPTRKKRRWHFNTFMLETFSRLEKLRRSQSSLPALQEEYTLLTVARDLVQTSPILFLDEFQLPDRAASKILSNLMTSFFQLGGVLIATSNRMPEELAKAAGMEFSRPVSRLSRLGWRLGMGGVVGRDDGPGQKGEFAMFLEVLRGRCEVWEMEGKKDYRRLAGEEDGVVVGKKGIVGTVSTSNATDNIDTTTDPTPTLETKLPKYYLITPPPTAPSSDLSAHEASLSSTLHTLTGTAPDSPIPWKPATLTVYGRPLTVPAQCNGTAHFPFANLCATSLGPADYITLASTYPTLCLTSVPVLSSLQKNEARRFITLLDALYEARCKLLVSAAAGPDGIFFPGDVDGVVGRGGGRGDDGNSRAGREGREGNEKNTDDDTIHQETFSEIHQDLTSPFRPNISSYSYTPSPSLPTDALEDDPPNRLRPHHNHHDSPPPNFSNLSHLTGADEKFAVKRAESRIWELCSGRWWECAERAEHAEYAETPGHRVGEGRSTTSQGGWWRPLPPESRHWEYSSSNLRTFAGGKGLGMVGNGGGGGGGGGGEEEDGKEKDKDKDTLFAHGASPFRTSSDAPPKIQWTHVWGTVQWGKRAGAWGKGVEGLEERRKEKASSSSSSGDGEREK